MLKYNRSYNSSISDDYLFLRGLTRNVSLGPPGLPSSLMIPYFHGSLHAWYILLSLDHQVFVNPDSTGFTAPCPAVTKSLVPKTTHAEVSALEPDHELVNCVDSFLDLHESLLAMGMAQPLFANEADALAYVRLPDSLLSYLGGTFHAKIGFCPFGDQLLVLGVTSVLEIVTSIASVPGSVVISNCLAALGERFIAAILAIVRS
jgi:hypothetical protein